MQEWRRFVRIVPRHSQRRLLWLVLKGHIVCPRSERMEKVHNLKSQEHGTVDGAKVAASV